MCTCATACRDLPGIERFPHNGPGVGTARCGWQFAGLLWLVVTASGVFGQEITDEVFDQRIQPLIVNYCLDCHDDAGAVGDVSLEGFASLRDVRDGRPLWLRVLGQLRAESMPPEDGDQPSSDERQMLIDWLDRALNEVDCSGPVNPGRVTLRRLNRHEYRNTVRDLLGLDYEPATDFPADDVGYGFDNIGDVLSLPPLLMEKYLAAAEQISQSVIVAPAWPPRWQHHIGATDWQGHGSPGDGGQRTLASNGEAFVELEFPAAGRYQVRVTAGGDQAGDEPVRISVRVDGREAHQHAVRARRDAAEVHSSRIAVAAGRHRVGVAFVNDFYRPATGNQPAEDRNLHLVGVEVRGPLSDDADQLPATHQAIFVARPDDQVTELAAARQILERLATRAFRRPVRPSEVDRLLRLVELADNQGDSFEVGVQLALQAILVSPHFLFRVEMDPEEGEDVRQLNDFELATRLSYFLWSSMPDDELFAVAERGALREAGELERQVRRMLGNPKSDAFIENFAGQWLQLRSLDDRTFDAQRFPEFDRELLASMRTETTRFFAAIVREDLSLLRLLDADFTYVNERLARHYGLAGVEGETFQRVSLLGTPRAGILTHASILAVTSNPTRTSPVKRGKFVLENLLASPPPPAPEDVPALEDEGRQLSGTLREQMVQHRTNPSCASCHQLMDPIGFALENFDAVGRFRTHDQGLPIDASGELPSGESFVGATQLRDLLLREKRDDLLKCMAEKTLVYALGRGLEYYDQCAVRQITQGLAEDEYRFSRLVLEVVKSDPFQLRGKKRSQP